MPTRVAILIPEGDCSLVNIEGSIHLLSEANAYLQRQGKPAQFLVSTVALSREPRRSKGLYTIAPDVAADEAPVYDLVLVPAIHGPLEPSLAANRAWHPWLRAQHLAGAELASMCIGAYLLAAAGLLDGGSCATHWVEAQRFAAMFPRITVLPEQIIHYERGIYTSGGAYSFLNLLLHLIEKHTDRDLAIFLAKVFEIEIDRDSQAFFMIFNGQKAHGDEAVRKAQAIIEHDYAGRLSVERLADDCAVSRRNLERRFKKATSNSVIEYVQRVRVEAAKPRLERGQDQIATIMLDVGYSDEKAFREVFRRCTGLSPLEYRNRYARGS